MTRLIRSGIITWKPGKFFLYNFNDSLTIIKSFTAAKSCWDALVRIGLDPHHFVGLGSASRACRSGSGFRFFYPGSRDQKGTGSWVPDPDPHHSSPGSNLKIPINFVLRHARIVRPYDTPLNPIQSGYGSGSTTLRVGMLYHSKSTFPNPNLPPFCVSGRMVMEPPSPQCVGREFVRQYYTLLNQAPLHLHRYGIHYFRVTTFQLSRIRIASEFFSAS